MTPVTAVSRAKQEALIRGEPCTRREADPMPPGRAGRDSNIRRLAWTYRMAEAWDHHAGRLGLPNLWTEICKK